MSLLLHNVVDTNTHRVSTTAALLSLSLSPSNPPIAIKYCEMYEFNLKIEPNVQQLNNNDVVRIFKAFSTISGILPCFPIASTTDEEATHIKSKRRQ